MREARQRGRTGHHHTLMPSSDPLREDRAQLLSIRARVEASTEEHPPSWQPPYAEQESSQPLAPLGDHHRSQSFSRGHGESCRGWATKAGICIKCPVKLGRRVCDVWIPGLGPPHKMNHSPMTIACAAPTSPIKPSILHIPHAMLSNRVPETPRCQLRPLLFRVTLQGRLADTMVMGSISKK